MRCVALSDMHNNDSLLDGIRAYARCCAFSDYSGSLLTTYQSGESGSSDDALASVSCLQPTQVLVGCTGSSSEKDAYDGSYPGNTTFSSSTFGSSATLSSSTDNTCNAQNGNGGSGVYAIARCADTALMDEAYTLQCIAVWGEQLHGSTVSCPSAHYFMPSCAGHSFWNGAIGQYAIENETCVVTSKDRRVTANALWYVPSNYHYNGPAVNATLRTFDKTENASAIDRGPPWLEKAVNAKS